MWFVYEIFKLEKRIIIFFKHTNRKIILSEENELHFRGIDKGWLCENEIAAEEAKIRDHFPLTGKYRVPAHDKCILQVKQNHSCFLPVMLHSFFVYYCDLFCSTLNKTKKMLVKLLPKTVQVYRSVTYGCMKLINSYRFLHSNLEKFFETLLEDVSPLKKSAHRWR